MKKSDYGHYLEAVRILSKNIANSEAFASSKEGSQLESGFMKTICWCQGLSKVYKTNPARIHLAGAWSEVVNILALVPLCFYRQSIISMRTILDEVLAWSYYESHPVEFRTSIRDPGYWVGKDYIYEFHRTHSWGKNVQVEGLGLWSNINGLYKELSRFIHAQTHAHMSLVESFDGFVKDIKKIREVIKIAQQTDEAVAKLLGSLYQDDFMQFSPQLQRAIVKGWSKKVINGLDLGL